MKAFECKMCGECCWGRGISVSEKEIKRMAEFLGIKEELFKTQYCVINKNGYELKTKESGYCIFLKKSKKGRICAVHPVKPDLCKKWPFFKSIVSDEEEWRNAMDACPGINLNCSFEDFVKQAKDEHPELYS